MCRAGVMELRGVVFRTRSAINWQIFGPRTPTREVCSAICKPRGKKELMGLGGKKRMLRWVLEWIFSRHVRELWRRGECKLSNCHCLKCLAVLFPLFERLLQLFPSRSMIALHSHSWTHARGNKIPLITSLKWFAYSRLSIEIAARPLLFTNQYLGTRGALPKPLNIEEMWTRNVKMKIHLLRIFVFNSLLISRKTTSEFAHVYKAKM